MTQLEISVLKEIIFKLENIKNLGKVVQFHGVERFTKIKKNSDMPGIFFLGIVNQDTIQPDTFAYKSLFNVSSLIWIGSTFSGLFGQDFSSNFVIGVYDEIERKLFRLFVGLFFFGRREIIPLF